jgi:hypothetical protein
MRRFISRFLLIALLAVVIGFYPLLAPTPHRIDQAHFELIQEGMTQSEVAAIFGVPAGRYDWAEADYPTISLKITHKTAINLQAIETIPVKFKPIDSTGTVFRFDALASERWVSRHGAFTLFFNDQGRVASRSAWTSVRIEPPWKRWWALVWRK